MAQRDKATLKTFFKTKARPTEAQFGDLIDSIQATLQAGNNITLTQNANGTVTIAASGGGGGTTTNPLTFTGVNTGTWNGSAAKTIEVPTTSPTPQGLTFTGAVTGSWNGSAAKSVAIPTIPASLPPTGVAGGALKQSYPNPELFSYESKNIRILDAEPTSPQDCPFSSAIVFLDDGDSGSGHRGIVGAIWIPMMNDPSANLPLYYNGSLSTYAQEDIDITRSSDSVRNCLIELIRDSAIPWDDLRKDTTEYTFVINNDIKLQEFINASFPIYRSVLVKSGTYNISNNQYTILIDLAKTGTYKLVFEPNAVINIMGVVDEDTYTIITCSNNEQRKKLYLENVTFSINNLDAQSEIHVFKNLKNLYNCGIKPQLSMTTLNLFTACDNIYNSDINTIDGGEISIFTNCNNIYNCNIEFSTNTNYKNFIGFTSCNNIINCKIYKEDVVVSNKYQYIKGFLNCYNIINSECKLIINVNGAYLDGFESCRNLNNCKSYCGNFHSGGSTNSSFRSCVRLSFCEATKISQFLNNSAYNACIMSEAGTIPVADTATGGYNITKTS